MFNQSQWSCTYIPTYCSALSRCAEWQCWSIVWKIILGKGLNFPLTKNLCQIVPSSRGGTQLRFQLWFRDLRRKWSMPICCRRPDDCGFEENNTRLQQETHCEAKRYMEKERETVCVFIIFFFLHGFEWALGAFLVRVTRYVVSATWCSWAIRNVFFCPVGRCVPIKCSSKWFSPR